MERVDLHTHSKASDGTYTPAELVSYAASKGLKAVALTDHDTVSGIPEALSEGRRLKDEEGIDIEVIPGIEMSSEYQGRDIHVVGLFIDHENEFIKRRCENFIRSRTKRNIEMCKRCTALGMPMTLEELMEEFPNSVITRAHFAKHMFGKGYVKSVKEAFDRFVGDNGSCFVQRKKMSPMRAVEIIRRAGGFPVLAHPVLYGFSADRLDELVRRLKSVGLMGIEALYSTYDPSDERDIRRLALKYDLAISGGSDFHGANKPHIDLGTGMGKLFIPADVLDEIKRRYEAMLKTNDSYRVPKVLLTDLDGTLLKDDKTISQYTYDILKRWTKAGYHLALCSGRDLNSVNKVCHDLKLDELPNVYSIAYNGGQIYDCSLNKSLYKVTLDIEDVRFIEEKALEFGIHFHSYSDKNIVAHEMNECLEFYTRAIKTPVVYSESISSYLSKECPEGPCKCLLIELHDRAKIEAFREELLPYASEHGISVLFSSEYYLEVFPSVSGKGASVKRLCDVIGIPDIITVGAGDEQNDISLIEACDIAIAMENGIEPLKEIANVISADTNENDGLAKTLEDFI